MLVVLSGHVSCLCHIHVLRVILVRYLVCFGRSFNLGKRIYKVEVHAVGVAEVVIFELVLDFDPLNLDGVEGIVF